MHSFTTPTSARLSQESFERYQRHLTDLEERGYKLARFLQDMAGVDLPEPQIAPLYAHQAHSMLQYNNMVTFYGLVLGHA